jgi:hypothetical protein
MPASRIRRTVRAGLALGVAAAVAVVVFSPAPETPRSADPACAKAYLDLYGGERIDFRLVFGYKDARPARLVADRYERGAIIERIEALGFSRSSSDDELFMRQLVAPDGKTKTLLLTLVDSAAGPDDVVNRKDPFQEWKSRHAADAFFGGLRQADVVLYNGHSRRGGGPEFSPPRLAAGSKIDYAWYEKERPGYVRMVESLRAAEPGPGLVGLFSCVSDRHFSQGILEANARTGLLVTETLLYFSDSLESSVQALEHLVLMRCQQDFHPAGTRLLRFF